jgi:hypothetical protein
MFSEPARSTCHGMRQHDVCTHMRWDGEHRHVCVRVYVSHQQDPPRPQRLVLAEVLGDGDGEDAVRARGLVVHLGLSGGALVHPGVDEALHLLPARRLVGPRALHVEARRVALPQFQALVVAPVFCVAHMPSYQHPHPNTTGTDHTRRPM